MDAITWETAPPLTVPGTAAVCFTSSPTFVSLTTFSGRHCLLHGGYSLSDMVTRLSYLLSKNKNPSRVETPSFMPHCPGLDFLGASLPESVLLPKFHRPSAILIEYPGPGPRAYKEVSLTHHQSLGAETDGGQRRGMHRAGGQPPWGP